LGVFFFCTCMHPHVAERRAEATTAIHGGASALATPGIETGPRSFSDAATQYAAAERRGAVDAAPTRRSELGTTQDIIRVSLQARACHDTHATSSAAVREQPRGCSGAAALLGRVRALGPAVTWSVASRLRHVSLVFLAARPLEDNKRIGPETPDLSYATGIAREAREAASSMSEV